MRDRDFLEAVAKKAGLYYRNSYLMRAGEVFPLFAQVADVQVPTRGRGVMAKGYKTQLACDRALARVLRRLAKAVTEVDR